VILYDIPTRAVLPTTLFIFPSVTVLQTSKWGYFLVLINIYFSSGTSTDVVASEDRPASQNIVL